MSFLANSEAVAPPKTSAELDDHESMEAIELEDRSVAEPFIQRLQDLRTRSTKEDRAQLKADQTTTKSLVMGSEKPDLRPVKAATTVNGHDKFVAEPFVRREQEMPENKDLVQLKDDQTAKNSLLSGSEKPDLRPVKAATVKGPEFEDYNKFPEWGIHSLTHSVSDELSGPISEVEDDPNIDRTDLASTRWISQEKEGRDPLEEVIRRSELEETGLHDFERLDGEIDSASGGQSHEPHSEEVRGHILSSNGNQKRDEGNEEEEEEDGEVIQASQEVQDDQQQSTEAEIEPLSGHYSEQSDSEEFSTNRTNFDVRKSDFVDKQLDDTASNLGVLLSKPREEDEESAQQQRLNSEITLLYPQPLEPEEVINPFSLEVRLRKAQEPQDISLEWEAETIAENTAGISQPRLNLEETIRSTLPDLEEISPEQPTGSSESAVENGLPSERAVENGISSKVREIVRTEAKTKDDVEEDVEELSKSKTGMGEAVLLGALASGVNRPTWFVIRAVLVGLVASLLLLLQVAIKSGSWFVLLNVLFLIAIAGGLILLLIWYIKEIGLVSLNKQMAELNLTSEPSKVESKTL